MRIDFKELGEGFHVELKDPKKLKWKEQKAITSVLKVDDIESSLTVAERLAMALIKSGYILDEDTNAQIQFPLTVDTVGELPSVIIEEVSKVYADSKKVDEKN